MPRKLNPEEKLALRTKLGSQLQAISGTVPGNVSTKGVATNTLQQYAQPAARQNQLATLPTPKTQKGVFDTLGDMALEVGTGVSQFALSSLYNTAGFLQRAANSTKVGEAFNRYTNIDDTVDDFVEKSAANLDKWIKTTMPQEFNTAWGQTDYFQRQAAKITDAHGVPQGLNEWVDFLDGGTVVLPAGKIFKAFGVAKSATGTKALANIYKGATGADTAIVNPAFSQLIKTPDNAVGRGLGSFATQRAATKTIKTRAITAADNALNMNGTWQNVFKKLAVAKGGGEATKLLAKDIAIEMAITAPIRRENIRFVADVYNAYQDGGYFDNGDKIGAIPGSVLLASFAVSGGPLGALTRGFKKTAQAAKNATFNENTYFDMVFKGMGLEGQFASSVREFMETAPRYLVDDAQRALRSVQAMNLSGRGAYNAAKQTVEHLRLTNDGSAITGKQIVEQMVKHNYLTRKLQQYQSKAKNGEYYILARFDRNTQAKIADGIQSRIDKAKAADDKLTFQQRKAIARDYIMEQVQKGVYWAQSKEIVDGLLKNIDNAKRTESMILNIRNSANTWKQAKGIPKALNQEFKDNGYVAVAADTNKIPHKFKESNLPIKSATVDAADTYIEQANIAKPFFKQTGAILAKAGLGLEDTAQVAYNELKDGLDFYITKSLGVSQESAQKIVRAIQQYTANEDNAVGMFDKFKRRTVNDIRQMRHTEIRSALREGGIEVTEKQAKLIKRDILQAHLDLPLKLNGLANWLIARNFKYNPAYKYYSRAQGAFRYTYNPFFKTQQIVEAELLGQGAASGKKPWVYGFGSLMPERAQRLDDIVELLENRGVFRTHGTGVSSYGAEDAFLGRINTVLTKTEKRNFATTVEAMADRMGMSVDELILKHGKDVEDIVRPIFTYPSQGVINSSLAKALNVAIFPARYNIKVTALAANYLSKQPPAVQALTINKLWQLESWLKSDEGIKWQRENAQALQLFRWLTPIGSVQWVFDVLNKPFGAQSEIQGVGDLGALGGLPFGVISQILDSQGIVSINTPYVSPEKGEIYTKYIPDSMKARMTSAFTDLLGSTFSYPGRTVGLPGKGQQLREIAAGIGLDPQKDEWVIKQADKSELNSLAQRKVDLWSQAYYDAFGVPPPVNENVAQRQYINVIDKGLLEFERTPKLNKAQLREIARERAAAKVSKGKKPKPSATTGPFAGK